MALPGLTILPHFLQYLRYIPEDKQLTTMQTALNASLSTCLHAYGHCDALLAEVGLPPVDIYQKLQLAQFRYRLATSDPDSLPFAWWQAGYVYRHNSPPQALENRMQVAVSHIDKDRLPIPY